MCNTTKFKSKKDYNLKNWKVFFRKNIQIDKVLSSEWCRCKQTAQYAFNNYETKSFLNSFFSAKFASNKDQQIMN